MEWNLTKIIDCGLLDNRRTFTPKLRAKDDPYGLAPIRVTDAESKPSTTSPKASANGLSPSKTVGFIVYPAKASNLGLTTFGSFLMRGQSSGLTGGNAPRSILGD